MEFLTKLMLNGETNLTCITVMSICCHGNKTLAPVSQSMIGD